MNRGANIVKRIAGTLLLPVVMYIVVAILLSVNGKGYYLTGANQLMMWKQLIPSITVSVTCALGIGLQFKSGRFDFSGGGIMLVSVIIAGNIAKSYNNNLGLFVILCMVSCLVLSLLVSFLYVYGRLPIIIATIGMALLFESLTCLLYDGGGVNLTGNMTLNCFSTFPMAFVPLGASIILYAVYNYFTTTGKQAVLLANNQQAAVNIGIDEKKNVIISSIFSGLIFGFATISYASTSIHNGAFTSLTTVGELFTNILPVFIGLMLAGFCGDMIGTIMGAITLCLLSYGLKAAFTAEMGSAITTVITGIFILIINVVSAQGSGWIQALKSLFGRKKAVS